MYQDSGAKIQTQPKEVSISDNAISRLMVVNDDRGKILHEIAEKLHTIHNQRGPMSPTQSENPSPLESDFFTRLHRQIGRAEDDNTLLRAILNHLSQIA